MREIETPANTSGEKPRPQSVRYEGLDAFRVLSSFYVVLGHVYLTCGALPELRIFLRAVTFSFPFIVMSSVFLLTRALIAKPDIKFKLFFTNSVKRLWLPFFIWTTLYSLLWSFIFPAFRGYTTFAFPPLTRIFTGYMHLWFLEFLFIFSILFYFIIRLLENRRVARRKPVLLCLLITALSEFLINYFFPNKYDINLPPVFPEAEQSLNVLFTGIIVNFFFIFPAFSLALYSEEINRLFQKRIFRLLSLALVFVCAAVHLTSNAVPYSKEIYTLAVFIAALQPWKITRGWIRFIATYSYAIYILHFCQVELLGMVARYLNVEFTNAFVLVWSIIIYTVSLTTAILLRKLFPFDWFMPLVPVGYQKKALLKQIPNSSKKAFSLFNPKI